MTAEREYFEAAVGYNNTDYYLQRFERFQREGIKPTWNWAACFFTLGWLLYRKMWLIALLYFLLPIPVNILSTLLGAVSDTAVLVLLAVQLGFLFIVIPMFANAVYFRHVSNRLATAEARFEEPEKRLGMLREGGGTSTTAVLLVLVPLFIAVLGILAAVAIPQYQQFVVKARINVGLAEAAPYKSAVAMHVMEHGSLPNGLRLDDVTRHPDLRALSVGARGVITITYAGSAIDGQSLHLVPTVVGDGLLQWRCVGGDFSPLYLPPHCEEGPFAAGNGFGGGRAGGSGGYKN